MPFPNLKKCAQEFLDNPDSLKTQEGLTRFICCDCDFYKEGEDEHLACGAYLLVKLLLEQKTLTVESIIHAVRSEVPDS